MKSKKPKAPDYDRMARKIVDALNAAYPESGADEQTWSDKCEAADNAAGEAFPVEQKELERHAEEIKDRITRNAPFVFYRDSLVEDAALDMLKALKKVIREIDLACDENEDINQNHHIGNACRAIETALRKAEPVGKA